MKFIQLAKAELFPKKQKRNRFAWVIDESKYLTLEKVRKLRTACTKEKEFALKRNGFVPVRNWFMIELGLNTGLRVEEMANLKCPDLLIAKGQSSLIVQRGKGGKKRAVRINKQFKNYCRWFLKWKSRNAHDIGEDAFLLTSSTGNHLTKRALQKAFKRCLRIAGIDEHFSIHCLRHTYGVFLYEASNHNLRLVQEQMGHSSVRVTEVYTHVIDAEAQKAVDRLYKR
jgi:integrase/recombinase XerC